MPIPRRTKIRYSMKRKTMGLSNENPKCTNKKCYDNSSRDELSIQISRSTEIECRFQPRRIFNPDNFLAIGKRMGFAGFITRSPPMREGGVKFTSSFSGPRTVQICFGQGSPLRGALGGSHAIRIVRAGEAALARGCVFILRPRPNYMHGLLNET